MRYSKTTAKTAAMVPQTIPTMAPTGSPPLLGVGDGESEGADWLGRDARSDGDETASDEAGGGGVEEPGVDGAGVEEPGGVDDDGGSLVIPTGVKAR